MEDKIKVIENQLANLVNKMERAESTRQQFKSLKDLKAEINAFFSLKGYSMLLSTNSVVHKALFLICVISLLIYSLILIGGSYQDFKEYNVVTQIKVIENESMIFPAVTFCAQDWVTAASVGLEGVLGECLYDNYNCSLNDFEEFKVYDPFTQLNTSCYKFNGGRNATNHETKLFTSTVFGVESRLTIVFNMLPGQFLYYFVGADKVRPVFSDLTSMAQPGNFVNIGIKTIVDVKLPEPYNACKEEISPSTSHLVKHILKQGIAYRQENCYDLCFSEYFQARNIVIQSSWREVNSVDFNYHGNCSHLCPPKCLNIEYQTSTKSYAYTAANRKNTVFLVFYFEDNRYTEITQRVKTTEVDFIANTGGVLGLFLELSFISVYRFIVFFFDMIAS